MSIDRIKAHFENEANEFDIIIQKLIPNYNEMIDALVSVIPFSNDSGFSVIDLGCGTGTLTKAVKNSFPKIAVTCVDIAEKMLEIAKEKIGGNVRCIQKDFNAFDFDEKYDLIISSLALHHMESDSDKSGFYKKIYSALNTGGMFINIDIVLGSNEKLQRVYLREWLKFMKSNVPEKEVLEKWLPNYHMEDRPAKLIIHLDMLKNCGFSFVDVVYKYYNYAVYCAGK